MEDVLNDIIDEAKGSTYINSVSINEFNSIKELEDFVKKANKNGIGLVLHYEASNFHCGVLVQLFDKDTCTVKDYLHK